MSNKKVHVNFHTPMDGDALARMLEKQARKGWHLVKYGDFLLHFEKGEALDTHYAVTFFPDATYYDPHMPAEQETYIDMCAQAGWTLVAAKGPMQIFKTDRSDPIPIETDEAYKLQAIHGSLKKEFLLSRVLLLFSMGLQLMSQWQNFRFNAFSMASDNTSVTLVAALLSLFFYLAFDLIWYFIWYHGSKRAVAEGKPCLSSLSGLRKGLLWVPLLATAVLFAAMIGDAPSRQMRFFYIAILAATAGIIALMIGLQNHFKKLGWPAKKTRNTTMVISALLALALCGGMVWYITAFDLSPRLDEQMDDILHLPEPKLTLADLGVSDDTVNWTRHEINESVLATHTFYSENGDEGTLEYQLLEIKWTFLRELIFETMTERYHFTEDNCFDDRWAAEMAYIRGDDRYIALYNNCILYVNSTPALTDDQVGRVVYHLIP